ncbi:hypothetical protein DB347_08845 [Opitutaceae bacterium EW11]|nr:hypothetical protein DB347_08845 [Opitutaceae bacterium EW11]
MAIRAVGFDFGETLATYRDAPLNWASLYRPALERVAAALGAHPTEAEYHDADSVLRRYNTRLNPRTTEVTADEIFRTILTGWSDAGLGDVQTAVSAFFVFFQQSLAVYPDTLATLAALRERGFRIGVLTDVPYGMPRSFVDNDLRETGILSFVDVMLTSVDVGWRKPSPEGFRHLAAALDVRVDEMIYLGNELKDIAGANAAPMVSVLVDRGGARTEQTAGQLPKPHAVVAQTSELLRLPILPDRAHSPSQKPVGITREQV